ncbi:dickkopf-related protein 3-like [Protopterus annectens]|uniref:dickkopf-related protein 3-like n=1 Tax=Protopterus annectens TaxID=7888 RepID=UPI001CFA4F6D|nr:dickkopf-related protein 3-like [Protopterus annectens]
MYQSMETLGFLLLVLWSVPAVHGHIWAWMLSIPYNIPEDTALARDNPSLHAPAKEGMVVCEHDRGCRRGFFCDKHFGLCVPLRNEGQYCRRDSQCSRALGCMFGKCQQIIPGGQEGARCKQDKDCGPSLCCARHHGEMVCKKRLTLGEKCYIPEGGLAFSINEICPCEEGLVCRNGHPTRETEFDYLWHDTSAWKCQPSSQK